MSKSAFKVTTYLPDLRRYALALTRHGDDAEDLVQEALARAYDRRASFRIGAALKPWLMAIVHNTFIDGVRAKRVRQKNEAAAEGVSETIPPSQEDAVRLSQVRKAFLELPDEQREALHLIAIEGLTYPEAAAVLNVPEGTVLSRVSRARQTLRSRDGEAPAPHLKVVGGRHD
jgi:RNA polymerase sigma-70 factor, ECF subfamily